MTAAAAVAPEPITANAPHDITYPIMLQGWFDLAALHWPYPPAEVQALLPDGFTVDTFDDSVWVGLIPFQMRRIRVPGLPVLGPLSSFPETNIRTYIVDPGGRRGVWFCSLDIARLLPAIVARASYRLPYCWADMTVASDGAGDGATWRYESRRRWPRVEAASRVEVRVGTRLVGGQLTELDHFLTARWALGTMFGSRLMWAKVTHPPWPIHAADVLECDESLLRAAGLGPARAAPIARWSPGVEVRIDRPRKVHRDSERLFTPS